MDALARFFVEPTADDRVLAVAYNLGQENTENDVTLVSRDMILRIKADALGIPVSDYLIGSHSPETDGGCVELPVERGLINQLYRERHLELSRLDLLPNQFAILRDLGGGSQSALARCTAPGILQRCKAEGTVWGVTPRNVQQRMALELPMDDQVQLVTLAGPAGTGNTLLTLAAALAKTEDEHVYRRLVVTRPVVTKVVLLGDPDQIDHPYLDHHSNGLVYATERFRGQPLAGHVTLTKEERSPLARLAASLL